MNKHFVYDTKALLGRSLRHILRSPDTIITTAMTPIAMLLMFVYVFGASIHTGGGKYVNYLLPGILLITVASGVAYTSVRLYTDISGRRPRALPVDADRPLGDPVGARADLADRQPGLARLVVLVARGDRLPLGRGLRRLARGARHHRAVHSGADLAGGDRRASPRSRPTARARSPIRCCSCPFVSSAFVLTAGMPGPVKWFAEHQPVTSIVDTLRNLYAEKPLGDDLWIALAWCVGILVVAWVLAVRTYHRRLA